VSYCPECDAIIDEEFEEIGEVVTCPECGVDLEVISLDPVEFDLAPLDDEDDEADEDEEFDFDDEDDDDDDDDWDDDESFDEDDDDNF
jgi:alpha-aminoadipate/glutamate carrier protein LysW